MIRRRGTLALRISLLSVSVALITAVVAGGIAVGLVRQANDRTAKQLLARLADAAQTFADYQRLTSEGKLGEAGQKLDELKRILDQLQKTN